MRIKSLFQRDYTLEEKLDLLRREFTTVKWGDNYSITADAAATLVAAAMVTRCELPYNRKSGT